MIGVITGLGLVAIFWAVIMCKAAAKPTPKPGTKRDGLGRTPGVHFDERGPY
jgi:hypothetical protein